MTDYLADDFPGTGYYLVRYGRATAPDGPHATVKAMAHAAGLTDYPADGYVLFHDDDRLLSNVPSLNPDDLVAALQAVRCPTATTAPDGTPHTIVGCGSTDVVGPDDEGLYDCRACGIFFDPAREAGVA